MRKKLRRCMILVLLIAVSFTVWANGGQEEDTTPTISFMNLGTNPVPPEILEAEIADFEQMMADKGTPVHVDWDNVGGTSGEYATKKTLLWRSGTAADVTVVEVGRGQNYMRAGYLLPLDDYLKTSDTWEYTFKPIADKMGFDGHTYMIPFQTAAVPLYYRKDLFVQAGMSADWNPKSWQDIIDAAVKIKEAFPDTVTPLLYIGGKEAGIQVMFTRFNLLLHGAGGTLMDESTGKWIVSSKPLYDTFKFYEELAAKGLIDPVHGVGASADEWAYQAFADGSGAISSYGPWGYISYWGKGKSYEIPNLEDVVGYVKMPAMEPGSSVRGEDYVTQSGGWAYTISAKSKNPDLAYEFLEFMTAADRQASFNAAKGQVGTRTDVIENPNYQSNAFISDISTWLDYTYLSPGIYPGYASGPQQRISDALGHLMVGEWTAEEALENYAKLSEDALGADQITKIAF